jgi:hypothetical protein
MILNIRDVLHDALRIAVDDDGLLDSGHEPLRP